MTVDPLGIPADLDALPRVREYVEQAAADAGLDKNRAYRLVLGVDEVVTNTITHGYTEAPPADDGAAITVEARITPRELVVVIDDRAPPFDTSEVAPPSPEQLGAPADQRIPGGLGLYLARSGVDRFDYEWKDGHNRSILTMERTTRKGAS
jgi:serine/threonine-protein kinase RsbW